MNQKLTLAYKLPMRTGSNKDLCPLSILAARDESHTWMFNHYSSFYTLRNDEGTLWTYLEFDNTMGFITPLQSVLYHKNNITDPIVFCKKQLHKQGYVFLYCDLFYISTSQAYNAYHKIGDLFITGVNEDNQTFIVYGYSDGYELREAEINIQEVKEAFHTDMFCNQSYHETYPLAKVFFFDSEYQLIYNCEKLKKDITEILVQDKPRKMTITNLDFPNIHFADQEARNEYQAVSEHAYSFFSRFEQHYGIDNYNVFTNALTQVVQTNAFDTYTISFWMDMLLEHITNLQFKFNTVCDLANHRDDLESTKEAMKTAIRIKHLSVKFNLSKSDRLLLKIIDQLHELKTLETQLLQNMLAML